MIFTTQTKYQFMVSEVLDVQNFLQGQLIQGFQQGFHCVKQSGFKGPYIC